MHRRCRLGPVSQLNQLGAGGDALGGGEKEDGRDHRGMIRPRTLMRVELYSETPLTETR
jgi:hypothetical protein